MRIAVPLLALAVACVSQPPQPPSTPAFRVVKSGGYAREATTEGAAGTRSQAAVVLAGTDADYRRVWDAYVGEGTAPSIDFATERAVFLFLGIRNTGGYGIDVQGVSIDAGELVVDAPVSRPASGGMSSQSLTSPWMLIAVKGPAFGEVRWRDRDGKFVASTRQPAGPARQ